MRPKSLTTFATGAVSAFLLLTATTEAAPQVWVSLDTGDRLIEDFNGNALTGGLLTTDHDGTVVQFGYYNGATPGNPFVGTWIPLTGVGSANTALANTTIGDLRVNGGADGMLFDDTSLRFTVGSPTTGNNLPGTGTPLAIRFYDATTLAAATHFEAVADDLWRWKTPLSPPNNPFIFISLSDAGLQLQSGLSAGLPTAPLRTVIPTPEPTTFALLASSVLTFACRRRR